jgi:hypothetical protein
MRTPENFASVESGASTASAFETVGASSPRGWGIAPSQAIVIDGNNAAQHTPIIDARLAVALGDEGLKPRHLRVRQPEKIAR